MNKEKIEFYKNKLLEEKMALQISIDQESKTENFGNDIDHFEEKADETDSFVGSFAVSHDMKIRLDDINLALQKIELGGYGICEQCKKNIEDEILEIDPESHLCKDCKSLA